MKQEIKYLPIDKIKPDKFQPRKNFDNDKLKELADTYKSHNIITPIEIDENDTIIIGERRYRAAMIAGLKEIPCIIKTGLTEEQKLERRLIENIQHEPLTELEKAEAIKKLIELKKWSGRAAAAHLGLAVSYVLDLLALVEAPKEIKDLIEAKQIAPSDVGDLIQRFKKQPEIAISIARKVAKANKNRRKLMQSLISEAKLKEKKLKSIEGEFNIIYADPPWEYSFSKDFSRSIQSHYPEMELSEICALGKKIPSAKDSILFLWATNPKLEEAFEVIRAWGYTYKTNFVWVKDKIGMGYYCRNQHELLLVATKGNFSPPQPKDRFSSVISSKRIEHSKKPEIVYEMIEKMYPNQKYLELFARSRREGWITWGLEIDDCR